MNGESAEREGEETNKKENNKIVSLLGRKGGERIG